jgi:hypothetical protein
MPQPVTILYAGPYRGGLVVNLTNRRTIRVLRKHATDEELFEELVRKTAEALNRKPENVRRALKERFSLG